MPCLFSDVSDTEAGRAKKEVRDEGVGVTTSCLTGSAMRGACGDPNDL